MYVCIHIHVYVYVYICTFQTWGQIHVTVFELQILDKHELQIQILFKSI